MKSYDVLKNNDEIIKRLRQIPVLKSFETSDFHELLRLSQLRTYQPGDRILEEGNFGGWIYYLLSGKVNIVKNGNVLLSLQTIGDIFGEMGAIEGANRYASVVAVEQTECLAVDISDIEKFSVNDKFAFRYIIYREFSEVLANRLRITTEELIRAKEELNRQTVARQMLSLNKELDHANEEIARLKCRIAKSEALNPISERQECDA